MFEFIKKLFTRKEKKQNINDSWTIRVSSVIAGDGSEQVNTYVDSVTKIALALSTNSKYTNSGQVVGDVEYENAMLSYVGLDEYEIIRDNIVVKNTFSHPTYDAIETESNNGIVTYYKGNPIDMAKIAETYVIDHTIKNGLNQDEMIERVVKVAESGGAAIAIGISYEPIKEDGFPKNIEFISLVVLESDY